MYDFDLCILLLDSMIDIIILYTFPSFMDYMFYVVFIVIGFKDMNCTSTRFFYYLPLSYNLLANAFFFSDIHASNA